MKEMDCNLKKSRSTFSSPSLLSSGNPEIIFFCFSTNYLICGISSDQYSNSPNFPCLHFDESVSTENELQVCYNPHPSSKQVGFYMYIL